MGGRDITLAATLAPLAAMGMGAADEAYARVDPDYQPTGINAGGFRFFPEIELAVEYNDNIRATATNEQSDYIYELLPSARLESDWNTHQLNLHISAPTSQYSSASEQNTTDVEAGADGRLDVDRGLNFTGKANYGSLHEPLAYSPSTQALAEPVKYKLAEGEIGVVKSFNQLQLSAKVGVSTYDYDNGVLQGGGVLFQDDRDRTVTTYGVRGDYAISPATSLFVSLGANKREYDLKPPDPGAGINRDSNGYELLGGAKFEVTSLLQGEIGVGYLSQSYDASDTDPTIKDTKGLAVRTALLWSPDELVDVRLGAERAVRDAGVAGAVAYVANDFSIGVDYAFRRNISATASVGYSVDDYQDVDRTDHRTTFDTGVDYSLNRGAVLFLHVGHDRQTSDGAQLGREYEVNRAMIGIRLHR
jgi:hypothetical protein